MLCGSIFLFFLPLTALFNRSLFFRASSFWDEPRFEKPRLTTFDIQLAGGSNHRGLNGCHKKTNILSIYGPEDVCSLSAVCPEHPLVLPYNPKNICFQAVADVFEADFNLYQNFTHGFFTHFHLPVIFIALYPSGYIEDTYCYEKATKKYKPVWQKTFKPIEAFLKNFDQVLYPIHGAALSDSTLFVGYTKSYDDTCYLDFIDFTFKTGVLFPTGKKKNVRHVFDIPYGYNGFWAVPLSGDISIGYYDWLTLGVHADNLFFFNKNQCITMKAPCQQSTGLIRLAQGEADVHHGTVWRVGTYVKADHFFSGLSLLLAFSYEQKNRTKIYPCTPEFNTAFVNDDERFNSWDRSMVHLLAEYDFTTNESRVGPRIGLFYDRQLTGKRVWEIHMLGGYLGIDINWCY